MIGIKRTIKLFALFTMVLLFAISLTVMAKAVEAEGSEGLEYKYDVESDSYFVIGIGECEDLNVVIPEAYEGKPVIAIAKDAFANSKIESASIPKSVTNIEKKAFKGSSLTKVILNDGLVTIGNHAFDDCIALQSITIPNTVTTIGEGAFRYCHNIIQLTLGSSLKTIGTSAFEGCYKLVEVYNLSQLNLKKASEYVADENGNIVISDGFAGYYALGLHTSLDEESILIWAENNFVFCNCNQKYYLVGETSNKSSIALPDSINGSQYEIRSYAFYKRTALKTVDLGTGVTKIDKCAFSGSGLREIVLNDGLEVIQEHLFDSCTALNNVVIPDTVKEIGEYAFYGCSSIAKINIPDSVTIIGSNAFNYCTALEEIEMGKGVATIGNSAFYFCTALEKINLGSVITIGDYAFYNCVALDTLVIPDTVSTIGKGAFKCCDSLIQLTLGTGLSEIKASAFENCYKLLEVYNLSQLTVKMANQYGDDETEIVDGFAGYYAISVHTSLSEESIFIWEENNFVFCYFNDKYYLVGETTKKANLVLPNSINGKQYEIIRFAFYNRFTLESIDLGTGVTKIGSASFNFCGLTSINIPSSVVEIAPMAFNECHLLESVYIADSVKVVGYSAFQKCYNLTSVRLSNSITVIEQSLFAGCKSLQYINLPKGITKIGRAAFGECEKLVKVVIPSTVTELGDVVFAYCGKLVKVIIPKGVVTVGENVFYDCVRATVYCGSAKEAENWSSSWRGGAKSVVWNYEIALKDAIVFKGYSTNGRAICAGYSIDKGVIEEYELSTGKNASIGFVYAKYDMLNGSNPLNENAEAIKLDKGKVISSSITELFASSYDIVLRNITQEYFDSDFVISMYTYDSLGVTYVQGESGANATGISYNTIVASLEQDDDYDLSIGLLDL